MPGNSRLLKTCPSRIDGNEAFQNAILNHTNLGQNGLVSILGVIKHALDRYEVISGNNPRMMITVSALWSLSLILLGLMGAEIGCIGFSSENITGMAFIA